MSLDTRHLLPCLLLLLGTTALPGAAAARWASPCDLVSKTDIAKATGLAVGNGEVGKPIPGVLGRCTWSTAGHTRVILTLADAAHMRTTVEAQQQTGGSAIAGLGTTAVGIESAGFTGGGYIVSALDAHGGFGVSILGPEGNRNRAVALAKVVEAHR